MNRPRRIGCRVLIAAGFLLLALLLPGQTMAVIDYDSAVSIGLQEADGAVGEMGVAANRGFGLVEGIRTQELFVSFHVCPYVQ